LGSYLILGATVMGLSAVLMYLGFRTKPVAVSDIRFPALFIPVDESDVFIAEDPAGLTSARIGAWDTPQNGATVIDAGFSLYREQNVKCDQGEIRTLLGALVRPGAPRTFKLELSALAEHGREAALQRVVRSAYLGVDAVSVEQTRRQLAGQTTMDGIIAVLRADAAERLKITPPP
jgi:hypothetical protein